MSYRALTRADKPGGRQLGGLRASRRLLNLRTPPRDPNEDATMSRGSETRRLRKIAQFRLQPGEDERLAALARAAGYESVSAYLRACALGESARLRRVRGFEIPLSADERARVRHKAQASGFLNVGDYARRRLLDRDTEGLSISSAIMELRRATGLQKHLFTQDQLRSREYAELLTKLGDAIEAVAAAAKRRSA